MIQTVCTLELVHWLVLGGHKTHHLSMHSTLKDFIILSMLLLLK